MDLKEKIIRARLVGSLIRHALENEIEEYDSSEMIECVQGCTDEEFDYFEDLSDDEYDQLENQINNMLDTFWYKDKRQAVIDNLYSLAETIEYVGDDYEDIDDRLCKECNLTKEELKHILGG